MLEEHLEAAGFRKEDGKWTYSIVLFYAEEHYVIDGLKMTVTAMSKTINGKKNEETEEVCFNSEAELIEALKDLYIIESD